MLTPRINHTPAIPIAGPRLRLSLVGHMALGDAKGHSYLPRTRKARALLAILAIDSPKLVLRPRLAALLWSRRENVQARASLRNSIYELQDTLGSAWSHILKTDRYHLSLHDDNLDIESFTSAHPLEMPSTLDRFRAVLLEDLDGLDPAFDRWLEEQRALFARIGRTLGETILAQCQDPEMAIKAAQQLLEIDLTHEGAWRTIMRIHAERGNIGAAVASYERCRSVLAERSGRMPSPETEDLMCLIRGSGAARWPPAVPSESARSMASPRPSLPPSNSTPCRDGSSLLLRVAPFRILGGQFDDDMAIGLAGEISVGISRLRGIRCVPSSLWPTASDGKPANASAAGGFKDDLLLEGTIQPAGQHLRIVVRLLDMRVGGAIVWSGRFDRVITDLLDLLDEVGSEIVAQITSELIEHETK